tara:strand:- start:448 stop:735 length:288 start_codon:yes stop_codon:yes gene_type:complete
MAEPALSSEQYVDQRGMVCPICEDTRFVYPTTPIKITGRMEDRFVVDMEGCDLLLLPMECKECGATWEDNFELTAYSNLKLRGVEVKGWDGPLQR